MSKLGACFAMRKKLAFTGVAGGKVSESKA